MLTHGQLALGRSLRDLELRLYCPNLVTDLDGCPDSHAICLQREKTQRAWRYTLDGCQAVPREVASSHGEME